MTEKKEKAKAITNQRTPQEIREIVTEIDKEVPDTPEFVAIMEKEDERKKNGDIDIEVDDTPQDEEIEEIEETTPQEEDDVEDKPVETPKKRELPPIEQRYKEAGQEAMILNSKNKKIMETIEEAENIGDPTIDELKDYAKQMGEDYDNLDSFAQNILKSNLKNEKRFSKISGLVAEEKQVGAWVKKVEEFVDLQDTIAEYPQLETYKDEFVKYASKKTHLNADLDLLVAGFMWKKGSDNAPKKSVLLPSGKGGAGASPKPSTPNELTEDDAMVYRQKDPKRYKQLIKQRKFKTSI